jgi:hypothetical protein
MVFSLKALFYAEFLLKSLEISRIELDHIAASHAEHMVVVSVPEGIFIDRAVFCLSDFFHKSALTEEVQRPVNRRPRCFQSGFSHLKIECFRIEMPAAGKDPPEDDHPLLGKPLSPFIKEFGEDFLFRHICSHGQAS